MKHILLLLAVLTSALQVMSQCNVTAVAQLTQSPDCPGDDFEIMGILTSDCPSPYTINYTWEVTASDEFGNPVVLPEYTVTGTTPVATLLPWFVVSSEVQNILSVCLYVAIVDENLVELSNAETCVTGFSYPAPMVANPVLGSNWCGDQICLTNVVVNGGSPPYTYELSNGETVTPNFWNCFDQPGVYQLYVTDANGCATTAEFLVNENDSNNSICENATPLNSGIVESDTLCTLEFSDTSCSGFTYYISGWYVINSENYTHMNIAFAGGYYNALYNMPFALEIYTLPNGDCAEAELLTCYENIGNGNCFDLADILDIQPNTDYYIRPTVQWTSQVMGQILVVLSNQEMESICGCTDLASCNYDPGALLNDGSCGYSGCTDPGACNYMSYATCDDGSCIFGNDLTGLVFHDLNGDGFQSFDTVLEQPLGNTGFITIEELNVLVYPDGNGSFVLPELVSGVYHITFSDPSGMWVMSVESPLEITLPTCNGLLIPLVPTSQAAAQLSGTGIFGNATIQCNNGFYPGIWVHNSGNVTIGGTVSLTLDPSLGVEPYYWAEDFDTNTPGLVSWNIDSLPPGATAYYYVHVLGPGAAMVGTTYPFSVDLILTDNNDNEFYTNTWDFTGTVTCAYDPNDKQANPVGYTDEHFILSGDEIEYKIRFQNTGNAPAFDVVIEDQIDIATLDLNTFEPVAASHSYSTIVQPDGLVKFVFNNIMLPDSGNNEPGSHGYVIYRISSLPDLSAGTEIENTAEIFFDDNPEIVTNTVYHTIYNCNLIAAIADQAEVCTNETLVMDALADYVESYSWYLDGVLQSTESSLTIIPAEAQSYEVTLVRSNPLCTVEQTIDLDGLPLPGDVIMTNGWELTAPDGIAWQWYVEDAAIDGAVNQVFTPTAQGTYYVITTNEQGCVAISEEVMLVGITEGEDSIPELFPNPVSDVSRLVLHSGCSAIHVYNLTGQLVHSWSNVKGTILVHNEDFAKGVYVAEIIGETGQHYQVKFTVQ